MTDRTPPPVTPFDPQQVASEPDSVTATDVQQREPTPEQREFVAHLSKGQEAIGGMVAAALLDGDPMWLRMASKLAANHADILVFAAREAQRLADEKAGVIGVTPSGQPAKVCAVCGKTWLLSRSRPDRRTCSDACRQRLYRTEREKRKAKP